MVVVVLNGLWPRGLRHGARDVEQAFCGKVFGPIWIRGTACAGARHPRIQGSMGRMVSSSSFKKKEPTALSELVEFETVNACALIGLHMMVEENALWLGSDLSPDLGDLWRNGCPKSPEWISSGPTSEADYGFEFYEHDVENMAIEVIGQDRSSKVISLFMKDWEGRAGGIKLPLVNGPLIMPRNEGGMRVRGAQSILLVPCVRGAKDVLWWNCHSSKA